MRWSYRLGRFFDIDVRVHVTFLMLLAWIAMQSYDENKSLLSVLLSVLFSVTVFTFVVMHEYGHALTARRFGVRTRGITLYPIGGVAMLESMPKGAREQILVALAGPSVNFVLAAGLATTMHFVGYDVLHDLVAVWRGRVSLVSEPSMLLSSLFWMNAIMGTFNLIPALPMDGGRVLNAALSLRMDRVRATRIASRVRGAFTAHGSRARDPHCLARRQGGGARLPRLCVRERRDDAGCDRPVRVVLVQRGAARRGAQRAGQWGRLHAGARPHALGADGTGFSRCAGSQQRRAGSQQRRAG